MSANFQLKFAIEDNDGDDLSWTDTFELVRYNNQSFTLSLTTDYSETEFNEEAEILLDNKQAKSIADFIYSHIGSAR